MTFINNKQQILQLKFTIAWIVLTLVFLSVVFYFQWQHSHSEKHRQYQNDTNTLAYNVDDYLEGLISRVALFVDKINANACTTDVLPKLQSLLFNEPRISGIIISDFNNKIICSTAANISFFPPAIQQNSALVGPFKPNDQSPPVFLLQKKLGQYTLGVFILQSTLTTILDKLSNQFIFIGLYDKSQQKMLLEIGDPALHSSLNPYDNDDYIRELQNFDAVSIILHPLPLSLFSLVLNSLIILLPLLFFSFGLYCYCRRIIEYRSSLAFALTFAVKNHQFFPVYQALWDESLQKFSGAEVLIRWKANDDEIIMPDLFIEEAEKTGLIVPMTLQLIERVFRDCKQLLRYDSDFHLAFNLSICHFYAPDFFNKFDILCKKYHVKSNQIMFELTERELFNPNEVQVIDKMMELRKKGYHLAIDDFGTGQSNLNYLQLFPFNFLKIDKLFIHTIGTGAITQCLTHSIINMAKMLQLKIIAEGVETSAQRDYLSKNKVDFMQGWFYAKPLVYKEFIAFIK